MTMSSDPSYSFGRRADGTYAIRLNSYQKLFSISQHGKSLTTEVGIHVKSSWDQQTWQTELVRALQFSRFQCPALGLAVEGDPMPEALVYHPLKSAKEAEGWAQQAVVAMDLPAEGAEQWLLDGRAPGQELTMKVYVFCHPDADGTDIFLAGSHGIFDARGAFEALSILLQALAASTSSTEELRWGQEVDRLPLPVARLAGLRQDDKPMTDAQAGAMHQLFTDLQNAPQTPPVLLPSRLDKSISPFKSHLHRHTFPAADSAKIFAQVKGSKTKVGRMLYSASLVAIYRVIERRSGPQDMQTTTLARSNLDARVLLPKDKHKEAAYGLFNFPMPVPLQQLAELSEDLSLGRRSVPSLATVDEAVTAAQQNRDAVAFDADFVDAIWEPVLLPALKSTDIQQVMSFMGDMDDVLGPTTIGAGSRKLQLSPESLTYGHTMTVPWIAFNSVTYGGQLTLKVHGAAWALEEAVVKQAFDEYVAVVAAIAH